MYLHTVGISMTTVYFCINIIPQCSVLPMDVCFYKSYIYKCVKFLILFYYHSIQAHVFSRTVRVKFIILKTPETVDQSMRKHWASHEWVPGFRTLCVAQGGFKRLAIFLLQPPKWLGLLACTTIPSIIVFLVPSTNTVVFRGIV